MERERVPESRAMSDPIDVRSSLELVTQTGLVGVLVWIARELGAIRQAVSAPFCRWVGERKE